MAKTQKKPDELPLEAVVIRCIDSLKAPTTTQDAVDQESAEYAVASLLRTHAEKRYEAAKRVITSAHEVEIAEVRNRAAEHMQKSSGMVVGEDWQLQLTANKPALRTDVDELRTELIRLGVSVDIIDKAINKVTKKATPALIISAISSE